MFDTQHRLASAYKDIQTSHNTSITDQDQLSTLKANLKQYQSELKDKDMKIYSLESEIVELKNKVEELEETNKSIITPIKNTFNTNTSLSDLEGFKTPTASMPNLLKIQRDLSETSKSKHQFSTMSFNIDVELDDDNLSEFPQWFNKSLSYKKFNSLVKLFMQTLGFTIKMIMKFKTYKNQELIEDLKTKVMKFVTEFNSKHQIKKSSGWDEQQQSQAIKDLNIMSLELKQIFEVTFGKPTNSKVIKKSESIKSDKKPDWNPYV